MTNIIDKAKELNEKRTQGEWGFPSGCEPARNYCSNPYLHAGNVSIAGCDEYFVFSDNPYDNQLIAFAPTVYEHAIKQDELLKEARDEMLWAMTELTMGDNTAIRNVAKMLNKQIQKISTVLGSEK